MKKCEFCKNQIDEHALKCHHCGEDVAYHWRFFKRGLVNWSSLIAVCFSLYSLWQSSRALDLSRREFNLKYFSDVSAVPAILIPHFETPGEDDSQVWVTVVLKAVNAGSVPAKGVELKYKIGGPCRGYFTNSDIEQYTQTSIGKFDLQPGKDKYFKITFTDAKHCARDYLANKQYIEVETSGSYWGMKDGKEKVVIYSSRFRNNADQFRQLD